MVKTIKQTVKFKAKPEEVYEALMDSEKHGAFTGSKCAISKEVGGKFKCYGDYIEGINVELVKNKKIVQKWRGKDFPEGHYSTVKFELKETADGGTKLNFIHDGVPDKLAGHIDKGWKEHYWDKMKKYLN